GCRSPRRGGGTRNGGRCRVWRRRPDSARTLVCGLWISCSTAAGRPIVRGWGAGWSGGGGRRSGPARGIGGRAPAERAGATYTVRPKRTRGSRMSQGRQTPRFEVLRRDARRGRAGEAVPAEPERAESPVTEPIPDEGAVPRVTV